MEIKKEELRRNSINVHQRLGTDIHVTQEDMDKERTNTRVYDYLCRLEEAKSWVGKITDIPEAYEDFEEEMRKGVYLAEIAKYFSPGIVKYIFMDPTLQYRHTDNINFFLSALQDLGLPKHFYFEVIDLYEKKNFPKVVYCIHALAHFLNAKGIAVGITSAKGKVFSKEDLARLDSEIDKIKLSEFGNIKEDVDESLKVVDEEDEYEKLRKAVEEELLRAGEETSEEVVDSNEVLSSEDMLVLQIKTFLYSKAFEDIYYRKNVSLFSIRKFLFIFFKATNEMIKEAEIDDLHKKINLKLRQIYNKEVYLEDIENRIKLMISNKLEIHEIKARASKVEEMNLKPLETVLHRLITNPKYLSILLFHVEDKEAFISTTLLPIFSNVNGKKEEYLFINLVLDVLRIELVNTGVCGFTTGTPLDVPINCSVLGTSSLAHLLMTIYFRHSKEGKIFRDGLYAIVKNLDNIEVECNPSEIHKDLFDKDSPMDVALENERVKESMKTRLMVVRGVLSSIVHFLESNIDNIPYILRYFLKIYGITNLFSSFIAQFLVAPDAFNSEFIISKALRSKAYRIVQLLNYVIEHPDAFNSISLEGSKDTCDSSLDTSNLLPIELEISYYSPIFPFLSTLSSKIQNILSAITSVSTLDNYFQLESLNELVRIQKSIVYLPVKTANSLILLIRGVVEHFDESFTDSILSLELLPDDNNVTLAFSLASSEVCVTYNVNEIATENYLRLTKKKLIYLLKVCKGRNIVDLLSRDSSPQEKEMFLRLKDEEMSETLRSSKFKDTETLSSITVPAQFDVESLDDLKDIVSDDLKFLESKNITKRANLYSEMLSMLAYDIVLLRFMSQERSRELRVNELTYNNLFTKEEYLDLKTKEYDDYFKTYSSKMVSQRNLSYSESSPISTLKKISKYGSYHFTAESLIKLGVLHQIYDIPDSRDVFFILRSDEPLYFTLEVYINALLISSPYNFRLEDILYMKKKNQQVFDVLGICSFNTIEFVKLLNDRYIALK